MRVTGLRCRTKLCSRLVLSIVGMAVMSTFYYSYKLRYPTYSEYIRNLSSDYTNFDLNDSFQNELIGNRNETLREGYLVWSPNCKIPDISPYHESIRHLIVQFQSVTCSELPPLTSIQDNKLVYNESVAVRYTGNATSAKMICCYHTIKRPPRPNGSNPDDVFNISRCSFFNKTVTLKDSDEFIIVKCNVSENRLTKVVYEYIHARITRKPSIKMKIEKYDNLSSTNRTKLNLLFIGIDSMSRLNIIRTMPDTVSFLEGKGFIGLKGYNKIDDNTFPNLIPILTGMTMKQLKNNCWKNKNTPLDDCPLLWRNASRLGYVTMYAEDEPSISTFNQYAKGFRTQPTDYYNRALMLASEQYMKTLYTDGLKICLGSLLTADVILDYTKQFSNVYKDNLYFSFVWMNSFSHNDINTPSAMDYKMLQFFRDLFTDNSTLRSTVVIFLSDHGIRFGKIRKTYIGWLEERLPFIYIWLPEWYKRKYKEKYHNLLTNRNRLTTPYDLHMTLRELILTADDDSEYTCAATSNCRSLLKEIQWNRSCDDAAVPDHWCTCSEYRTFSTEGILVRAMVNFALREINSIIDNYNYLTTINTKCSKLVVKRVLTVRSMTYDKPVEHNDYILIFETMPGAALFETTIRHNISFKIMDSISRINAYDGQSECMTDAYAKKYCFCVLDL